MLQYQAIMYKVGQARTGVQTVAAKHARAHAEVALTLQRVIE